MTHRKFIAPAILSLMCGAEFALAQATPEPTPQPTEAPAAPEPAPAAEPVAEGAAQETPEVADMKEGAADKEAERKAVAPRTAAQAAIAQQIARSAPARPEVRINLSPAAEKTVMFGQTAKKVSDVSIIASVDQQNKLELLDITGGSGGSSSITASTPSFSGPNDKLGAASSDAAAGNQMQEQPDAPEPAPTLDSPDAESAPSPND